MKSTLERIDPDNMADEETTGGETLRLHIERYDFAGKFLTDGTVADVACGTGYGSFLLATNYAGKITKLIGIDNHPESIDAARKRYSHPKIEFVASEAMHFKSIYPLNNIVSLETIEHLSHPQSFIEHFATQLLPGGRFITSVPITPSMDANPYHLHDFSKAEFQKMFIHSGLRKIHNELQIQHFSPAKVFKRKEQRTFDLRRNLPAYYIKHPWKLWLRIRSTFKDGFVNKYLLSVYEKT